MNLATLLITVASGAAAAWGYARPARSGPLAAIVAVWWLGAAWLAGAFVRTDLGVAAVAGSSSADAPLHLRLAAIWAAPSGSLWVWCTLVATGVAVVAHRSTFVWARRSAAGCSALLTATCLLGANPFATPSPIPRRGAGLSPVLEHGLMTVHPPLLYAAQAATIAAAVAAAIAIGRDGGDTLDRPAGTRRAWAIPLAALAAATILGAWWAHDEAGWGGWWAWDPVENTALTPMACLVAAGHARTGRAALRWIAAAATAVLLGVVVARTGWASSVHAFAPSRGPAIGLASFTLAFVAGWITLARRRPACPADEAESGMLTASPHRPGPRRVATTVTAVIATAVAVVVAAAEVAAAWLGTRARPAVLDPVWAARALLPAGVLMAVALAGWGWRRHHGAAATIAHLGVAALAVGAALGTGSSAVRVIAPLDRAVSAGTDTVRWTGSTLAQSAVDDPGADRDRLVLHVTVSDAGGRAMSLTPMIERYPDLGSTRSRPARAQLGLDEIEVAALYADDERATIEVRTHRGLLLVWWGAALAIGGVGLAALRRPALRAAEPAERSVQSDE